MTRGLLGLVIGGWDAIVTYKDPLTGSSVAEPAQTGDAIGIKEVEIPKETDFAGLNLDL